jgi:hypothetical protein
MALINESQEFETFNSENGYNNQSNKNTNRNVKIKNNLNRIYIQFKVI